VLSPRFDLAIKHLSLLSEGEEEFTFQTFCDDKNKDRSKGDILAKTFHGRFEDLKDELAKYNNLGAGIFVCVNKTDLQGVKKSNMLGVRSYFAEADSTVHGEFRLEPTFVIQSKNGTHSYFCLSEMSEDLETFPILQSEIAKVHKTDPVTKNINRVLRLAGFYHLKDPNNPFLVSILRESYEYYTLDEVKKVYEPPKPGRPKASSFSSIKGVLLPKVEEFLSRRWCPEDTNHLVIHSAANCKRNGYSLQECIEAFERKGEKVNVNTMTQIRAIYSDPSYIVDPFIPKKASEESNSIESIIWESKIYRDCSADSKGIYLVNNRLQNIYNFNSGVVNAVLGKEAKNLINLCVVDYDPEVKSCTFVKEGLPVLNTYIPPDWAKDNFFNGTVIEPCEMPLEYKEFFNHLFGKFPDSLNYVLDWIAHSLKHKNITVLSLVGTARGIGKSCLASILKSLHGDSNFEICNQSILSKEFNSQMRNKTMVNFDEVSIIRESDLESIKAYTNSMTSIEGKGIDSKLTKIYANILLTNNNMECLTGVKPGDDRQFSVPEITDVPITADYFKKCKSGISKIETLWEDKDLVAKFARYLYNRDLSQYRPERNFKSPHYFNVVRNSRLEWQSFLIEEFLTKHYNCAVPFLQIQSMLKEREGIRIGRIKFDSFCKEYSKYFYFRNISGSNFVFCANKGEQFYEFQSRCRSVEPDDFQGFEKLTFVKPLID
jgi:hypothetical protein